MRNAFLVVTIALQIVVTPADVFAQAAVVLDSGGARVGVYGGPAFAGDDQREGFLVISTTGYAAIFDEVTGNHGSMPRAGHVNRQLGPVRFSGPNCTGTVFIRAELNSPLAGGFVFRAQNQVYYAPHGVISAQIVSQSTINDNGECVNVAPSAEELIQVVPNDPAVTGFSNGGYPGPLRLGFLSTNLFADSFELA